LRQVHGQTDPDGAVKSADRQETESTTSRATLEALASCPPSGWGRSFDVITRIFDLRLRFVYGDAQRPADPYFEFSAPSLALPDQFKIKDKAQYSTPNA
jgi:hypothetical protein